MKNESVLDQNDGMIIDYFWTTSKSSFDSEHPLDDPKHPLEHPKQSPLTVNRMEILHKFLCFRINPLQKHCANDSELELRLSKDS